MQRKSSGKSIDCSCCKCLKFRYKLVSDPTGPAVHGKLSDRHALNHATRGCGQADDELCKHLFLAIHNDPAAMGLRDNVVADRQAEAGSFARWLGGEERL